MEGVSTDGFEHDGEDDAIDSDTEEEASIEGCLNTGTNEIERADDDDELTDVMRQNRVKRDMLDIEWQAKSMEVIEAESRHKEVSACIVDRRAVLTRIEFVAAGDRSSLEKMAKKVSKARCNLKSFRN